MQGACRRKSLFVCHLEFRCRNKKSNLNITYFSDNWRTFQFEKEKYINSQIKLFCPASSSLITTTCLITPWPFYISIILISLIRDFYICNSKEAQVWSMFLFQPVCVLWFTNLPIFQSSWCINTKKLNRQ